MSGGGPGWHRLPGSPLDDASRAPIRIPPAPSGAYRGFLVKLLEGASGPGQVLEAAIATGSALLEGAEGFVTLANELAGASPDAGRMKEAARKLLLECGALLKSRQAAYALEQAAEVARARVGAGAASAPWPRIPRLRDYMTPIEESISKVKPHIEAERLAPLLVRLDEFYDDAVLQLARALHVASLPLEEARALAPGLLERLYRDFARASFEDHLLAQHEKDREVGQGTGLRELLPELVESLENA